jgi:hypothetical protein
MNAKEFETQLERMTQCCPYEIYEKKGQAEGWRLAAMNALWLYKMLQIRKR